MATHKVITAKNADNGNTVYLTSCDAWTPDIAVAELLQKEDEDWRLAFANRLHEVTGPALLDAVEGKFGMAELAAA
ncbi:MAG: DUF2849 domain-containing protein [Rhodobacteraceae bacterium]|nr:DUF2849 domain-containing protein [Paracoccaceae bacterium]